MRFRQLLSDQNTSLADKLKEKTKAIANNVSFSLFDYEKSVSNNIMTYFGRAAENLNVPSRELYLRICQEGSLVKAYLYHIRKQVEEVPANSLASCFMGELSSLGDESKVTQSVGRYLDFSARQHNVSRKELNILISSRDEHVAIKAYVHEKLDQKIPLGELIKFFKS